MRKIFWLASYPKSGNTWFRLMLASFRREAPVDINNLAEPRGMASARGWFDHVMLFPSGLLTHEECERLRPLVYAANDGPAGDRELDEIWTRTDGVRFVKTHDAYTRTPEGRPMMGGREAADGVILIVRDPRDVCASLANHNGATLDQAINFMGHAEASFCGERDRQPLQLRQQLLDWSGYNASWLDQADLPVHLVRYEDMQADAASALGRGLAFAGIEASADEVAQAAAAVDFGTLRQQERAHGFREAPRGARAGFFRSGVSGGWRSELDAGQVARIEREHGGMMGRLGYQRVAAPGERVDGSEA
ncbi:MAG: sulfotransferase domain-containing protein [Novosphingobium sp.]|nr:sulfotransferase domain-containing protein [Novosphingobium sp.]